MNRHFGFLATCSVCLWSAASVHAEAPKPGWTASPDAVAAIQKQIPDALFDEAGVPKYTLPDPLVAADGTPVTRESWPQRRAEILELFRGQVYGRAPVDRPEKLSFSTIEEDRRALDGRATRRLVEISFDTPHAGRYRFETQLFLPNKAKQPAPAFVWLQFRGLTDPATSSLIDRGYAVAIFEPMQLAADDPTKYRDGIIDAFSGPGPLPPDAWGGLAAWAWGASRVLDYLETVPEVDAQRVAVNGVSRMGKAALWAGANDPRFAAVISTESGCGGAALSRRRFGETVRRITSGFPQWFCENFRQYNDREAEIPVDQHMLVALVAPRLVYVASADEDLWGDPRGEFLACVGADPVYRLLGLKGLGTNDMPPLEQPVADGRIGYHIRRGHHGVTDYDWQRYMDFLDRNMPAEKR
jgi:(4-O-methyl)-D-glucuronate---lignin esterase